MSKLTKVTPFICVGRAGHHAVIDWLIHLNPDSEFIDAQWDHVSYEPGTSLAYWNIENVTIPIYKDYMRKECPQHNPPILLMRSFKNQVASWIKAAENNIASLKMISVSSHYNGERVAINTADIPKEYLYHYVTLATADLCRIYASHALYWQWSGDGTDRMRRISYDMWFSSEEYRKNIADLLGLPWKEGGISGVRKWRGPKGDHAGCSAFDQSKYDGKAQEMDVLNRYKTMQEHPTYQEIMYLFKQLDEFSKCELEP